MKIKKYIARSLKYLLKLVLLFAVLFTIMDLTGTSTLPADNFFAAFFGSMRGQIFTAIVLVWCIYYPKFEFVTREYCVDMSARRATIMEAMQSLGMNLATEGEDVMIFRSASGLSRLWQMNEDAVEIRKTENGVVISGSRKNVANAMYKIKLYAEREDNE